MTGLDVAGVLSAHAYRNPWGYRVACSCNGWTGTPAFNEGSRIADHRDHVAAAISAHIAEVLGSDEVFDAAAFVISDVRDCADAALTAVGVALGVAQDDHTAPSGDVQARGALRDHQGSDDGSEGQR